MTPELRVVPLICAVFAAGWPVCALGQGESPAAHFRRPIALAAVEVDGAVELRVDDAGPGIPHDQLELVFERFYRIRSTSTPIPGTGLGLAICRRIVEAHGGCIRAENREHGARFVVRLPVELYAKGATL